MVIACHRHNNDDNIDTPFGKNLTYLKLTAIERSKGIPWLEWYIPCCFLFKQQPAISIHSFKPWYVHACFRACSVPHGRCQARERQPGLHGSSTSGKQ